MPPGNQTSDKPLAQKPFSYKTRKNDLVQISHSGKVVTTLQGNRARRFTARIERLDEMEAQHLMARETGQFKFGNERQASDTRRGNRR